MAQHNDENYHFVILYRTNETVIADPVTPIPFHSPTIGFAKVSG
jgi:hypothetical protein